MSGRESSGYKLHPPVVMDLSALMPAARCSDGSWYMSICTWNQHGKVVLGKKDCVRTPPESTVFGTAIRIGHGISLSCTTLTEDRTCGIPSQHIAKAQKFNVLTGSACSNHGCFLEVRAASMGRVLSMVGSSARPSCHTSSLLSLPWL